MYHKKLLRHISILIKDLFIWLYKEWSTIELKDQQYVEKAFR